MNRRVQKRQRPAGTGRVVENVRKLQGRYSSTRLPYDWRARLERLDVLEYYQHHVAKLSKPNASGWAQCRCPFHDDRAASFSVHVTHGRGSWRCFSSCGGGDLIGFHQRATGLPFAEAVRDLLREVGA